MLDVLSGWARRVFGALWRSARAGTAGAFTSGNEVLIARKLPPSSSCTDLRRTNRGREGEGDGAFISVAPQQDEHAWKVRAIAP